MPASVALRVMALCAFCSTWSNFQNGYMNPQGSRRFPKTLRAIEISGQNGIGIPAMHLAYAQGMEQAQKAGISALAIRNVGHTGRHGAFADHAAECGF